MRIQVAHTADLTASQLDASRALLYAVFDDMTEHDWEHALGGMHALAWEGDVLIGHGSVIQRQFIHKGRSLRAGYVEAVAVRGDRRRQGIGGAIMADLERIIRAAYELGALGASDDGLPFYLSRGWQRWRGTLSVLGLTGALRTPDEEGYVLVLPGIAPIDLDQDLICDWRSGDAW